MPTPESLEKPDRAILVCDDNPSVRKILAAYIEMMRYRCLATCSSDEALQAAREHLGQLHGCLIDLQHPRTPEGDLSHQAGPLLGRLLETLGIPREKIAFMTGGLSLEDQAALTAHGYDGKFWEVNEPSELGRPEGKVPVLIKSQMLMGNQIPQTLRAAFNLPEEV